MKRFLLPLISLTLVLTSVQASTAQATTTLPQNGAATYVRSITCKGSDGNSSTIKFVINAEFKKGSVVKITLHDANSLIVQGSETKGRAYSRIRGIYGDHPFGRAPKSTKGATLDVDLNVVPSVTRKASFGHGDLSNDTVYAMTYFGYVPLVWVIDRAVTCVKPIKVRALLEG